MNTIRNTKFALLYEIILVSLALLSVLLIGEEREITRYLDWAVWALFFIDISVRMLIAPNKWKYIKENPFDIIVIVPFDAIFQTARIIRLLKVLRLIAISKNYLPRFFQVLKTNNLDQVIVVALLIIIFGGLLVTNIEPKIETLADGLWWAIVTTTTVGYGDISPETIGGRIIAGFLMLVGIGLIGMITSSITTFFIKDEAKDNPTMDFIRKQLSRSNELTASELSHIIILLEEFRKEAEMKEKGYED